MVATVPPPVDLEPPADGEAPRCIVHIDTPATWTSPTGHTFCQLCRESWNNLHLGEIYQTYKHEPVDLNELIAGDPPTEEWYVEPLFPKGKLIGITSTAGHGKSLLLLDIACKKATGEPILEQAANDPESVVYLDMEQGPDELYDRLTDLGYTRAHPLWATLTDHLFYYQLIPLPPLNTKEGGEAIEQIIERHQATFVVIDTLARVIAGNENDAEPYQELFRYTETMLKRRAITLARLDHLGKDTSKGARGSSAKIDGLDVMWQMEQVVEPTMQFKRTKGRQPWVPEKATIHRVDTEGVVSHSTVIEVVPEKVMALVDLMDTLDIPPNTGTPTALTLLKDAGKGHSRAEVRMAVRYRKRRPKLAGHPSASPIGQPSGQPPPLFPKATTTRKKDRPATRPTSGQPNRPMAPPIGGPVVGQADSDPEEIDYDTLAESFDPADLEEED